MILNAATEIKLKIDWASNSRRDLRPRWRGRKSLAEAGIEPAHRFRDTGF